MEEIIKRIKEGLKEIFQLTLYDSTDPEANYRLEKIREKIEFALSEIKKNDP